MEIIRNDNPKFSKEWHEIYKNRKETVLYSLLNIEYQKKYLSETDVKDLSFIVYEEDQPIVAVILSLEIYADNLTKLSGFGNPICYIELAPNESDMNKVQKKIKEELDDILSNHKISSISYRDYLWNNTISYLGKYFLEKGATGTPFYTQIIDLSLNEDQLRKGIRKSYKSLINWGKKNLKLQLLQADNITQGHIDAFRQLHIEVAERETRSKDTWDIQLEMVQNNEAFILFGKLENKLVSAGLFMYNSNTCYYGVSASKRELFEKPLFHYLMWQAILHSKKIGCRYFEAGMQLIANAENSTISSKESGISKFKKGFGGATKVCLDINL